MWQVFKLSELKDKVAGDDPCIFEFLRSSKMSCAIYRLPAGAKDMPVSYTHLDVYKRQVRHEVAIKRQWMNILQQPRIKALRLRYAPQIMFIRARLSPRGYFGAQMTAGALMLIGSSWLFGGISEDVATGDPLTIVDLTVAEWFHTHATPLVTQFMICLLYTSRCV